MRIARVTGTVTLGKKLPELRPGRLLIVEALDFHALAHLDEMAQRQTPMPQSLVVFDELGAGAGQIIAVSEGGEACMPFHPDQVPLDAYCAAIIDEVEVTSLEKEVAAA